MHTHIFIICTRGKRSPQYIHYRLQRLSEVEYVCNMGLKMAPNEDPSTLGFLSVLMYQPIFFWVNQSKQSFIYQYIQTHIYIMWHIRGRKKRYYCKKLCIFLCLRNFFFLSIYKKKNCSHIKCIIL